MREALEDLDEDKRSILKNFVYMCKDILTGKFFPAGSIGAIIAALGYFLMPFDIWPDFFPGGFSDDVQVIITLCGGVIADYIRWRKRNVRNGNRKTDKHKNTNK